MLTMAEAGTNSAEFALVPKQALPTIWPIVARIISYNPRGLEEYYTLESLYTQLFEERLDLWVVIDGGTINLVVLTTTESFPKGNVLHIVWCGGEGLQKYMECIAEVLLRWACFNNCKEICLQGRSGWTKLLKKYGVDTSTVLIKKDVRTLWRH